MTGAPVVSVIATTYNHEQYVEQCLDAIAAQTFDDFELIVMDDCSTDGSLERIRSWVERTGYPAKVLANEENLGICAARNRALSHCRGEFVSFVAGDDWYEPDKLTSQVELFRTLDDRVGVVFANCNRVGGDDDVVGTWFTSPDEAIEGWIFDHLLQRNHIPAPTVMVRRSTFDAVGPYDESLVYEDDDMWLRVADRFQFRYLDRVVLNKRYLPTSLSHDDRWTAARYRSQVQVLLKWVGRNPVDDALISERAWSRARRILAEDPATARVCLQAVYAFAPSPSRRAFIVATGAPGSRTALRWLFDLRDSATPRLRSLLARIRTRR